jgi:hypothetical protein
VRLEVELADQRQVDAKLEALWTSTTLVQDLGLGDINRPSSLTACLSMAAESFKGRIDTVAASGVC